CRDMDTDVLAVSADGSVLATASEDVVRVWDGRRAKERFSFRLTGRPVTVLALAPDGRTLAVIHNRTVLTLWDVERRQERLRVGRVGCDRRGIDIGCIAFAPDGRSLAYAYDAEVVWLETGTCRRRHVFNVGPAGRCNALAFSPDGLLLAAAAEARVGVW